MENHVSDIDNLTMLAAAVTLWRFADIQTPDPSTLYILASLLTSFLAALMFIFAVIGAIW